MFLSNISVNRPVFAAMLMLMLVVLGLFSARSVPVDQFPNVEWGVVSVSTVYPGASPETVERQVSRPVEEALNAIQGVRTLTSTSSPGFSQVITQFELEENAAARTQDVRDKISQLRGALPRDIEEPVIQSFGEADEPILSVALSSTSLDFVQLTAFAEEVLKRRLESAPGVGNVRVLGGQERVVRITLDPARLAAYGLGADQVAFAIRSSNLEIGAGIADNSALERDLTITGRLRTPEDFGQIIVGRPEGQPVFLQQVATIEEGGKRQRSAAFLSGVPTVSLDIQKVTGANTVEVAEESLARIEKLRPMLPAGTTIEVVRNNSEIIRDSLHELQEALLLAALLTIFVVYLFLGSWRSTIITGLTLPIAIVSTFIIFDALNFTFNVISTMGLVISIGLLIDDAIVVRENIVRHLAMGKSPMAAAKDGTAEIGLAVLAATLTLVSVFVPVAFMGGIVGKYFYEFGLVVAFAVLVSLLVSFTLDPMLSSIWHDPAIEREVKLLRGERVARRTGFGVILDWLHLAVDALSQRYEKAIAWSLRHPWIVVGIAVLSLFGAFSLVRFVGVSFVPEIDGGEFIVDVEAPESSSLAYTTAKVMEVDALLASIPEVTYRYATIGGSAVEGPSKATVFVKLVPLEERKRGHREVMSEVRPLLSQVAGVRTGVRVLSGGGPGADIQVSIVGPNSTDLEAASQQIQDVLATVPGAVDIRTSYKVARRSLDIEIDRQRAAWYSLDIAQTGGLLRTFLGEDAITQWEDPNGEAHDVILTLPESWRQSPAQLAQLPLTGDVDGRTTLIPLAQVATVQESLGASRIEHRNLQRVIAVSANVEGRDTGGANREFQQKLATLRLPDSVSTEDSGEGQQIAETGMYAIQALLLAIIFIYLILASQFNSVLQPFAIMASLPLSLIGLILGLLLFGSTLNIMSMIGLIMLMGLVTKNAILLVEFANQARARGVDRMRALELAGRTRLRPILMTTFSTLAGMAPLAFVLGSASEFRAPMAQAIMGGVATSTLLTLFVVPVAYIFWDNAGAFFRRLFRVPTAEDIAVEGQYGVGRGTLMETPAE